MGIDLPRASIIKVVNGLNVEVERRDRISRM